jgi:pimeloyl-ACP methyl ester carboxylesterase
MSSRGLLRLPTGVVNYLHVRAAQPVAGLPPIVLLGGTAQTLNSMLMHHAPFSKHRDILHYECRGQGVTTTLSLQDCSLKQHVEDFNDVMSAMQSEGLFERNQTVDIVGFSFGGRLALAIAANSPDHIRKIVATGAPADRRAMGRVILRSWLSTLQAGNLKDFMWQSMFAGHSASFLSKHESKLEEWVNSAVGQNRCEAILALVRDTHTDDIDNPWHTLSLAQKASNNGLSPNNALFISGQEDLLAVSAQCKILSQIGGWTCMEVPGAAHAVPVEKPEEWRDIVLSFLSQ